MYSLNSPDYIKEFRSIEELIRDIVISGISKLFEITKDGIGQRTIAMELIIR
jgi:hypothetical protein